MCDREKERLITTITNTGVDIETREEVGVKFEHVRSRRPQLQHEFDVMALLEGHGLQHAPFFFWPRPAHTHSRVRRTVGFVRGIWYGTQGDYHALVMGLLGPNLFQLMGYCGGHFSLKTVLMLGEQMVCRFVASKHLHETPVTGLCVHIWGEGPTAVAPAGVPRARPRAPRHQAAELPHGRLGRRRQHRAPHRLRPRQTLLVCRASPLFCTSFLHTHGLAATWTR